MCLFSMSRFLRALRLVEMTVGEGNDVDIQESKKGFNRS